MIDKTNELGILVTLDQEKAFDRVDHIYRLLSSIYYTIVAVLGSR